MIKQTHTELLNIDGELETLPADTYTVQQAVNLLGFGWFHVKLSLFVGLCWMADSMEMTILSIIGPTTQCEWNVSTYQKAFMTTIVFLGMIISPSFWTQLSDRYGRKSALTFCGVLLVLYSLLSSVAPTFTWLIILRALVGFSIGCIPQSVTLYAEFLPSKHKGKCVILMDCFWALGACFEIALALAIYPNFGWRWLLGFSTAPLLLFTSLTPWITESARFHTINGNYDKAVRVLEQIAKDNNRQMLIGRLTSDYEANPQHQLKTLFKPELRKITLILWFLWMSCAFCYYGLVLISAEVFLSDKAVIKRHGKKKTMTLQFIIFSVCMSILSLSESRIYTTSVLFLARGVISGLFQAAYIYTPDIYPNNLRSLGVGGCSTIARLGAMATPFVSQVLFQSSAFSAFMVYTSIGLLSAVACIILPESQILI
ncbi:synaptic vesicle 2-related protein isoform X2 [Bactrocera neohumeralis]|uniref:synaptic vesicle 2-related protein isoform X2 n=1 Tax=Bactrocera neohumeralis TaxID=98809 RepID=UPI0021654791|nr:synaptic vesicle 2-related protein isoform X2 [Bactrocera neohumeralis]